MVRNDVVQKALRSRRKGARVVYVPAPRRVCATTSVRISAASRWSTWTIHEAADGAASLHPRPRPFRSVVTQVAWLALLGDKAYFALIANRVFYAARRLGFGYWSLSKWAKLKVKNAVSYIGEFEKTLVDRGAPP